MQNHGGEDDGAQCACSGWAHPLCPPEHEAAECGDNRLLELPAAVADLPWTTAYNCSKVAVTKSQARYKRSSKWFRRSKVALTQMGFNCFPFILAKIETDLHQTAFPENLKTDAPYVLAHMAKIGANRPHLSPELPAWTVVFLATGRAKALKGNMSTVPCTSKRPLVYKIISRDGNFWETFEKYPATPLQALNVDGQCCQGRGKMSFETLSQSFLIGGWHSTAY